MSSTGRGCHNEGASVWRAALVWRVSSPSARHVIRPQRRLVTMSGRVGGIPLPQAGTLTDEPGAQCLLDHTSHSGCMHRLLVCQVADGSARCWSTLGIVTAQPASNTNLMEHLLLGCSGRDPQFQRSQAPFEGFSSHRTQAAQVDQMPWMEIPARCGKCWAAGT